MYSAAIFEACFSDHKDIWITVTDYNMYCLNLIVLFSLKAILQLIKFTAS